MFIILIGSSISIIPKSTNRRQKVKTIRPIIKTLKAIAFIGFFIRPAEIML